LTSVSAIIHYSRTQTCSADPSEEKLGASGKKILLSHSDYVNPKGGYTPSGAGWMQL